jgi:hypothetical protein
LYKCSNSCLWCSCWWNLDFSFKSYGKESLQILYECWRWAYHALLAQLFILFVFVFILCFVYNVASVSGMEKSKFHQQLHHKHELEHLYNIYVEIKHYNSLTYLLYWQKNNYSHLLQTNPNNLMVATYEKSPTIWWIKSNNSGMKTRNFTKKYTDRHIFLAFCIVFIRPSLRRDVLWYTNVRLPVRLFVRLSVRPSVSHVAL